MSLFIFFEYQKLLFSQKCVNQVTYQDEVELRLEESLPLTRMGVLFIALELVTMLGVTRPGVLGSDVFVQMVELSDELFVFLDCMR